MPKLSHSLSLLCGLCYSLTHGHVISERRSESLDIADTTFIDLGYALYQGAMGDNNVTSFLGIRYAAPPTGNNRWAAPQPPANTTSRILVANEQPAQCYQAPAGESLIPSGNGAPEFYKRDEDSTSLVANLATSEDCLFLNVYVPGSISDAKGLPVLVWIHGGSYLSGQAAMWDGSQLVTASENNLIAVVIQYRLGLFGFLAGSEVGNNGTLNAGLLDQQYALQWIQDHISSFGGDPTQVTIWGQSAGAGSVMQHVIANGGQTNPPLFRAAMTSSFYLPAQYNYNDTIPEQLYNDTVFLTGCDLTPDTLQCLRDTDVSVLQSANVAIAEAALYETSPWVPVVDGSFIQKRVTQSLSDGVLNGKALLSTYNSNEAIIFVNPNNTLSFEDYLQTLFPNLLADDIETIAEIYASFGGTAAEQIIEVVGEILVKCPTQYAQQAFGLNGWQGQFGILPAMHLQDLSYYFPNTTNPELPPLFNNTAFLSSFPTAFLKFAVSMDPNTKLSPLDITPSWSAYNSVTEMLFNKTEDNQPMIQSQTIDFDMMFRCDVWSDYTSATSQ